MDALIFYGLVIVVGLAALRALFSPQPAQPQVIYMVAEAEPAPARGGLGCLPLIIVGVLILLALRLLGAA